MRNFQRWLLLPTFVLTATVSGYLLLSPEAPSQTPHRDVSVSDNVSSSGLKLEATTIDFGSVYEGEKVRCPLSMTNTAAYPIEVIDVSTSCGCTTVEGDTPVRLLPGETHSVTVQLDTANNVGSIEKRVMVFTHEGNNRFKFPVTLTANSRPLVDVDRRLIDFGMLKTDDSKQEVITVKIFHAKAEIEEAPVYIASVPEGFASDVKEVAAAAEVARQFEVAVSVDGESVPAEALDGDLVLVTPSTVESVLRIPLRARQHSFVSCVPPRVDLGALRDSCTRTVRLTCESGHSFAVESVEAEAPEFVTADWDAKTEHLKISIDRAAADDGYFKGIVRVRYRCDAAGTQQLTIPVSGYQLPL